MRKWGPIVAGRLTGGRWLACTDLLEDGKFVPRAEPVVQHGFINANKSSQTFCGAYLALKAQIDA